MLRIIGRLGKPCTLFKQFCSKYFNCSHPHSFHSFSTNCSIKSHTQRHPFEHYELNSNSVYCLSLVLQESTDVLDFRAGLAVHSHLLKLYMNGFTSLWNKLLNVYCKSGQFGYAYQMFDNMPGRNVVSFNSMILTCVRNGYGFEAVSLYSEMIKEENVKPNHITLAGLIGACDGVLARKLFGVFHAQAIRYGLSSNEYVGCSLIDGYAKEMRLKDSIRAFDEIDELDLVSWNIMIDACVRNNSKDYAVRTFSRMVREKVVFDGFTLTSIAKTCSELRDLDLGMLVHGCGIKCGLACGTPISNALITMYSKCEGMISALKIFEAILEPNIITWTAMIAGFMQNGHSEEAISFYCTMLRLEVKENDFTFASILPVYSNLVNLEQGRQIHARIVKSWFGLDVSVNNALIDMYSKCGSLEEARTMFKEMKKHDKVSYTSIITALGQHGKAMEALKILEEMVTKGLNPDDVTFLGCLSACSHGGYVDEGTRIFKTMVNVYNLKPRREHLSCIVDMLGRAGRLKEAELFIEDMGIKSNVYVWEALLGACKLHGEIALGEKSAKKIIELQPDKHCSFVLLGNIYAEQELWEGKGVVRESLDVNGSKKENFVRKGLSSFIKYPVEPQCFASERITLHRKPFLEGSVDLVSWSVDSSSSDSNSVLVGLEGGGGENLGDEEAGEREGGCGMRLEVLQE
ncbi:hypothetical protein LguiB_012959 [Lonicera macranthoides]